MNEKCERERNQQIYFLNLLPRLRLSFIGKLGGEAPDGEREINYRHSSLQ